MLCKIRSTLNYSSPRNISLHVSSRDFTFLHLVAGLERNLGTRRLTSGRINRRELELNVGKFRSNGHSPGGSGLNI